MKDEDFFKSRKIGIIGGLGAMGLWFEKYFKKKVLMFIYQILIQRLQIKILL